MHPPTNPPKLGGAGRVVVVAKGMPKARVTYGGGKGLVTTKKGSPSLPARPTGKEDVAYASSGCQPKNYKHSSHNLFKTILKHFYFDKNKFP